MTAADPATARQIVAADPSRSTWVSANAGSGKTRVLIDRVARLLLRAVPPEKVLCLTYTKAAAAEMQNRLFARLGTWAMLPDEKLRKELAGLGEAVEADPAALGAARRLFARAIEAPGGLKIQTIHSFCASLLRRFPLEAGVPPDFTEIDDRAQALLIDEVFDAMADGPDAGLVEAFVLHAPGDDLSGLLSEIVRSRESFDPLRSSADWRVALGAGAEDSTERLLGDVFLGGEQALFRSLAAILGTSGPSDRKAAAILGRLANAPADIDALLSLERLLLFGKGAKARKPFSAKLGEIPTKPLQNGAAAPLMPALKALMLRVEAARPRRCAIEAAERLRALHLFAARFLERYAAAKQARGWLDFDDLILGTRALLRREGVADWVLFRLDGGIDHILVDEAQDTSPAQWDVIRLIAEEFSTAGSARSNVVRTIFVVGDLKQSIYSFQGADPGSFLKMAAHFGDRLSSVGSSLQRTDLLHSFRSAQDVLRAVDMVFRDETRSAGLGGPPQHWAFHRDKPGRVDLWPAVPKEDQPDDAAWYDPVDRVAPADPDVRLARLIAAEISRLCDPVRGEQLPVTLPDGTTVRRPVTPGDVLILVQRRSTLFAEVIRACKAAGLPIAGADRLRLGGELAVKDLAAFLSFLSTPEDDLSLAAVLRSPLFGWTEDRLYRLAAGRGERYLWWVLRGSDETETLAVIDDLRASTDFLRPYELLERILTRHGGRRKLLARLGPEAEDGLDALLAQAMAYERSEVPSLTGFLTWMETEDVEVKRQLPSDGGVVRVMTVHGAKGLESPIVILPDTRAPHAPQRGDLVLGDDGIALWRMPAETAPAPLCEAMARARRREAEERMRLLYVAMTRAESWLIVAGAGDVDRGEGGWYAAAREALEEAGALPVDTPAGPGLRLEVGSAWGDVPPAELPAAAPAGQDLRWSFDRVAPPVAATVPLSPSDLGGAKALSGDPAASDATGARRRGSLLHRLLEVLPSHPPSARAAVAAGLAASAREAVSETELASLLREAEGVIDADHLGWLFGPDVLAEVEITAAPAALGGRRLLGAIDRLIVSRDRVVAVDFKSNALVPARPEDVPEGILRQMGAYAAALSEVFPGRTVETAVVWTATAAYMPLPGALVAAALARVSAP